MPRDSIYTTLFFLIVPVHCTNRLVILTEKQCIALTTNNLIILFSKKKKSNYSREKTNNLILTFEILIFKQMKESMQMSF